ncbi:MAG: LysR family transcriptional regulator, partial [Pseudomonadota bacterium]
MLPPPAALRSFAALAEAGTLSGAGRALNVSHAAIGQQLRALEAHMGVPLAHRAGRGIELTPEGKRLATAVQSGFSQIAE